MHPPGPATAVLILRAWAEANAEAPFRFRITGSLDVEATDVDCVMATSVGEVVDVVERWAEAWTRRSMERL